MEIYYKKVILYSGIVDKKNKHNSRTFTMSVVKNT